MSTPHALTREQVEKVLCRFGIDIRAEWRGDWKALGDTDAAQRLTIEQQAQEIEQLNTDLKHRSTVATPADCTVEQNKLLRIRLAAMTTERDETLLRRSETVAMCDQLQAELAASQTRCRELERERDVMSHSRDALVETVKELRDTIDLIGAENEELRTENSYTKSEVHEAVDELIEKEKNGLNKAQYIMALQDLRALFEEEKK